jgi:hypothetical protein
MARKSSGQVWVPLGFSRDLCVWGGVGVGGCGVPAGVRYAGQASQIRECQKALCWPQSDASLTIVGSTGC